MLLATIRTIIRFFHNLFNDLVKFFYNLFHDLLNLFYGVFVFFSNLFYSLASFIRNTFAMVATGAKSVYKYLKEGRASPGFVLGTAFFSFLSSLAFMLFLHLQHMKEMRMMHAKIDILAQNLDYHQKLFKSILKTMHDHHLVTFTKGTAYTNPYVPPVQDDTLPWILAITAVTALTVICVIIFLNSGAPNAAGGIAPNIGPESKSIFEKVLKDSYSKAFEGLPTESASNITNITESGFYMDGTPYIQWPIDHILAHPNVFMEPFQIMVYRGSELISYLCSFIC